MRLLWTFFLCCFLPGCEATDYYFTIEKEKEVTSLLLYSDKQVTLSYKVYNGLISTLRFHLKHESKNTNVEVVKYEHYLFVDNKRLISSIIHHQGVGEVRFNENLTATITSKLVFKERPEDIMESIHVELLIDGRQISISKELALQKGSFSRFEALMNI